MPAKKYFKLEMEKVSKERNFPGYILIEANLVGEIPHVIKSIPGVIGFWVLPKEVSHYQWLKLIEYWVRLMS